MHPVNRYWAYYAAAYAALNAADYLAVRHYAERAVSLIFISLIRPGPLQGDMVHPFLRRRLGEEPVSYLRPDLEDALAETLGVILFQEQVLKVAHDLAGFTPGQGELLRRALGRKDSVEAIREFEVEFVSGAMRRGVDEGTARLVFGSCWVSAVTRFPRAMPPPLLSWPTSLPGCVVTIRSPSMWLC
jgi:hypothetical protein